MRLLQSILAMVIVLTALFSLATPAAAEVKISKLDEAPPADALSDAVIVLLQKTGYKVTDGDKVICEFWLCETWTCKAGFKPSATILYPIQPGTLVGALRFPEGGSDFRQQQLESGVYTMRHAHQPQDGNHIGTSDTLDFMLLCKAEDDQDVAAIEATELIDRSAMAAGSTHPAMIALRPAATKLESLPAVLHDEAHEWTSVRVAGAGVTGDQKSELQLEFVVVGYAPE